MVVLARLASKVHVIHGQGGVVRRGGASDGIPVDDGDPSTWFVDAVMEGDLVSLWDSCDNVWG